MSNATPTPSTIPPIKPIISWPLILVGPVWDLCETLVYPTKIKGQDVRGVIESVIERVGLAFLIQYSKSIYEMCVRFFLDLPTYNQKKNVNSLNYYNYLHKIRFQLCLPNEVVTSYF